jgi:hypothetical protein
MNLKELTIDGYCMINGGLYSNSTLESVSFTTGSFVISGGMGVSGNIFGKGALNITGACFLNSSLTTFGNSVFACTTDSYSPSTGAVVFSGGVGIMKSLYINGALSSHSVQTGDIFSTGKIDCKKIETELLSVKDIQGSGIINIDKVNANSIMLTSSISANDGTFLESIVTKNLTVESCKSSLFKCDDLTIKGIHINDNNGLFTVTGNKLSGLRLSLCDSKNLRRRYYSTFEIFSLGNNFICRDFEALHFSNDSNGDWNIMSRSNGTGKSGDIKIQSSAQGSSIRVSSSAINIDGDIILNNGARITVSSENEQDSYTIILPKEAPKKGIQSVIACDEDGNLFWLKFP